MSLHHARPQPLGLLDSNSIHSKRICLQITRIQGKMAGCPFIGFPLKPIQEGPKGALNKTTNKPNCRAAHDLLETRVTLERALLPEPCIGDGWNSRVAVQEVCLVTDRRIGNSWPCEGTDGGATQSRFWAFSTPPRPWVKIQLNRQHLAFSPAPA